MSIYQSSTLVDRGVSTKALSIQPISDWPLCSLGRCCLTKNRLCNGEDKACTMYKQKRTLWHLQKMRRSKRSIEVEPTLKNHHHFFWGGPCLIPDKFGASPSSISDRKWRGPRGHSAELPCGFSRLEGLQPTGSLRQADGVVGMLVWVIYTINTMYIRNTGVLKKPQENEGIGIL